MARLRLLSALAFAGILWALAAPSAEAGVRFCNNTRDRQDIWIAFITVQLNWGPANNTVATQGGWDKVVPGRCSQEYMTNLGYFYIEGSKGGIWRSQTPGTDMALRTIEPQTGWWCVNKQGSATWPNYMRKITSQAACPAGSYLVHADIVPIISNIALDVSIN